MLLTRIRKPTHCLFVIEERKKLETFYFKGLSSTSILEKMRSDLAKVKDHICSGQFIKDRGHIDSTKEIQLWSLPVSLM